MFIILIIKRFFCLIFHDYSKLDVETDEKKNDPDDICSMCWTHTGVSQFKTHLFYVMYLSLYKIYTITTYGMCYILTKPLWWCIRLCWCHKGWTPIWVFPSQILEAALTALQQSPRTETHRSVLYLTPPINHRSQLESKHVTIKTTNTWWENVVTSNRMEPFLSMSKALKRKWA